jgi:predicted transcriptional regulator
MDDRLRVIEETQTTILNILNTLVSARTVKDWYSVDEVAERVGRTEYQVREWLRFGRMLGVKRAGGRGRHKEWSVSHEELTRYLNHGLRPALNPVTS